MFGAARVQVHLSRWFPKLPGVPHTKSHLKLLGASAPISTDHTEEFNRRESPLRRYLGAGESSNTANRSRRLIVGLHNKYLNQLVRGV
jgi:hypothetical protein